jgi:hypothetical protein
MSGGKLPGKTEYAGRRRAMTRRAGFSVHPDTTGGEFRRLLVPTIALAHGEVVQVTFAMHGHGAGDRLGYGLWFWHTTGVAVTLEGGPQRRMLSSFGQDSWNKVGSIWTAPDAAPVLVRFTLSAARAGEVAIYTPLCGRVEHGHLVGARERLLRNLFEVAPEGVFVDGHIEASVDIEAPQGSEAGSHPLMVKSCNRCGRFLPINAPAERNHLSFTNHCSAEHLRPCMFRDNQDGFDRQSGW